MENLTPTPPEPHPSLQADPPTSRPRRRRDLTIRFRYCIDCRKQYGIAWDAPDPLRCSDCDQLHRDRAVKRLVIRIPAREGRPCTLCNLLFPTSHYNAYPNENRPGQCKECQRSQRCSACRKIKKNAHFKKGGSSKGLFKTCDKCRGTQALKLNDKREAAAAVGAAYCGFGRHTVRPEEMKDNKGVKRLTCQACLTQLRERRAVGAPVQRDDPHDDLEDHVDGEGGDDGVEYGGSVEMPVDDGGIDVDVPEDSAIGATEAAYLKRFREALDEIELSRCHTCNEADWNLKIVDSACQRCRSDKGEVPKWSAANSTMPDIEVPACLKGLTDIEEQMIAGVHTMMQVRHTRGRQLLYNDHIVNFPQDITPVATHLPRLPESLNMVIIRRESVDMSRHVDFIVRREKVRNALAYKIQHDPSYAHLQLDEEALSQLPINGSVADRIPFLPDQSEPGSDELEASGPIQAAEGNSREDSGEIDEAQVRGVVDLGSRAGRREVQEVRDGADAILRGPIQYQQEHVVRAPDIDITPISETRPGYIPLAFPTLFPTGAGDLHQSRMRKVDPGDYFQHLFRFHDGRFSRHRRFPWFAFNTLQRMRAFGSAKVFVRQHHDESRMTAEEMRQLLAEGDTLIANKMIRYGASLRGTRAFWMQRRQELIDMIGIHGTPHLFFTLSAADLQWPDLHRHMPSETEVPPGDESAAKRQRRLALQRNPHLAASYLDERLQLFQKYVLNPLFGVKHFWYRYEWQDRGSGHIHGFFWLDKAPDVDKIDWDLLKTDDSIISEDQDRRMKEFVEFWDGLISAVNPAPREDENSPLLGRHPCSKPMDGLRDTKEELAELLNWVERHTKCKEGYCKVKRKVDGVEHIACRFDFPFRTRESASVCKDSKGRLRFEGRRNDPLLNMYNATVILGWRANIDLKPVLSKSAAIQYVAKYATKAEQQAPAFPVMLNDILGNMNGAASARTACQKLLNKMVAERAYSAQETAHLLHGIPLVRSSVSFATLNLSSEGSLREVVPEGGEAPGVNTLMEDGQVDNDTVVTGDSWMQRYMSRPAEMSNLSMQQVFTGYTWYGKRWRARRRGSSPTVLRVFPRHSPNPEGPLYEEYCRVKILLHHPFHNPSDLISDGSTWAMLFADCNVNHQDQHPPDTLRRWENEADRVIEEEDDDEEMIDPDLATMTEEDWQLYARFHPTGPLPVFTNNDIGRRPIDDGWDVSRAWDRWHDAESMAGYLDECRRDRGNGEDDSGDLVDLNTLSPEQTAILHEYTGTYQKILDGQTVEPMFLNIDGTAGCGKTYLIRAICQELRRMAAERDRPNPIRVVAPSGVAALNIGGRTCHSAFGIPASNSAFKQLSSGSKLASLQLEYQHVFFLIIDEKSMLGQRVFAKLDSRLRQIRPHDSPFGGFHVSLIGDFAQLPPVGDRCLYAPAPVAGGESSELARHGALMYQNFTHRSYWLTTVFRQRGPDQESFRNLLEHASKGGLTREDWNMLLTREEHRLSFEERKRFDDSVCLFTKCEAVGEYNLARLVGLNQPCARIQARHEGGSEAHGATAEEAMGLENEVVLAIGAKVMISKNIWQQEGLVNGTLGEVYDVVWAPGASRSELPLAVLVACPTYKGPTLWRSDPTPGFPEGVPLVPVVPSKATFELNGKPLSRMQLPLRLAWAVTVHKSQGLTLDSVRIGLGKKEFAAGLTFVALSRVKTFAGLMLVETVDYSRVQNLGGRSLAERLEDIARRYPRS